MCLNFSHLQSTLQLMQCTYWDIFSTAQNSFWTCWFWCLLVLLPFCLFVCFTSSKSAKHFPLMTFFHPGKQDNVIQGEIRWIRRVRHGGHAIYCQKLLSTQHSVGRWICKSPIMKWANMLKESSKKIHWSWTQPLSTMPAGTLKPMGS